MSRKKPAVCEYEVPMSMTIRGYVTVLASSEDEARSKAENMEWIACDKNNAETVDWEVIGNPERQK